MLLKFNLLTGFSSTKALFCFKNYEENHGYPVHLNKREFVEFLTFNLNQMGDEEVYLKYKL